MTSVFWQGGQAVQVGITIRRHIEDRQLGEPGTDYLFIWDRSVYFNDHVYCLDQLKILIPPWAAFYLDLLLRPRRKSYQAEKQTYKASPSTAIFFQIVKLQPGPADPHGAEQSSQAHRHWFLQVGSSQGRNWAQILSRPLLSISCHPGSPHVLLASLLLPDSARLGLVFLNKSILRRDTFSKGKTIKKSKEWRTQKMGWQFPDGGGGIAIRWAQERLLMFNTVTYMAGIHVLIIFLTVHMFYKNLLYVHYIHFTI